MSKPPPRKYPNQDLKILYGRAAARCAFPVCRKPLILESNPQDGLKQIGKISHIVAHSDNGPRGDASYPREKLDTYDNWVLLCPTCHDTADAQPSVYTTSRLRALKAAHEKWVDEKFVAEIAKVGFAELELVTKAIVGANFAEGSDFTLTPPTQKIQKNGLTGTSQMHIMMGLSKAKEVARFVENEEQIDIDFAERLKAGFTAEYNRLKALGITGDPLFLALCDFAGGPPEDLTRRAAGVVVLAYLFERCDLFEK